MSFHVLIVTCEQNLWSFIRFRMISSDTSQPCYCIFYFLQLSPQLIALDFLVRQILQPAGTPPFLRNLVVSPVHHAEFEQEDIGITQLIGNDSNTYNGIFRHFDASFFFKNITRTSGFLVLLFVKSLFQFGAKEGRWEGYYGEKNYFDMSFLL